MTTHLQNADALIERLDDLSHADLDALPIIIVQVDGAGRVIFHNAGENPLWGSGFGAVVGRDFFRDIAPAANLPAFRGRFLEGVRRGSLDERFGFTFGLEPQPVRVEVRMRQAREPDRYWIVLRTLALLTPSRQRLAAQAVAAVERRARAEPLDPGVCEREPIHTPGAVQPHAAMLACDPQRLIIQACSDNVSDVPGASEPVSLIGQSLEAFLPADLIQPLRRALLQGELADPARAWRRGARLGPSAIPFALVVHQVGGRLVLEFERVAEWPEDFAAATPLQAQDAVSRLRGVGTLIDAAQVAARQIRAMTSFERVLIYRFDDEWNGEAIAEDQTPDWTRSLLGLRFPASDIPAQARALYTKSPGRFVVDRDAVPAAILTEPQGANQAVDLTFAQSRALSPIHLEYQRNLGVNGSMSLSILVKDRLWGLVIGHHRTPHYVTPETRALAGLVADAFGLRVHELVTTDLWYEQQATLTTQNRLLERLAASDDFVAALTSHDAESATLLDLFAAGGAAVVSGERVATLGVTPSPDVLQGLTAWLRRDLGAGKRAFATDRLSEHVAAAQVWQGVASGLLAAFVGDVDGPASRASVLLWFRPEVAATVVWGGDPNKPVLADTATSTVLPRRSFERWVEERRGQSEPWAPWQIGTAEALAAAIEGVVLRQGRRISELTAKHEALTRALEQKDVLAREIDHRVRNSLQIVAGVMLMQARGVSDPAAKAAFEDTYARVMSVARVHDSLQQSEDVENVDLGQTLQQLCADLTAGITGASQRLDVSAEPGLMVPSRAAVALALIATELVTNALKYAYAPGEPGQVEVSVKAGSAGGVELKICDSGKGLPSGWSEQPRGSGRGLGMRVIRAMLEQIGAELKVESDRQPGACFTVLA